MCVFDVLKVDTDCNYQHQDDEATEQRALRDLWALVRAGRVMEACRLCTRTHQYFRAASLAGAVLFRDPNLEDSALSAQPSPVGSAHVEGDVNRVIWKYSCMQLSSEVCQREISSLPFCFVFSCPMNLTVCVVSLSLQKGVPVLERGLYGALCGNLEATLPACSNWDDCVWAHFRCMLEAAYERELCKYDFSAFGADEGVPSRDRVQWWRTHHRTADDVFAALKLSPDLEVRKGSLEPYHLVQSLLIMGRVPELVELLADWVCKHQSGWVQRETDQRYATCFFLFLSTFFIMVLSLLLLCVPLLFLILLTPI